MLIYVSQRNLYKEK